MDFDLKFWDSAIILAKLLWPNYCLITSSRDITRTSLKSIGLANAAFNIKY